MDNRPFVLNSLLKSYIESGCYPGAILDVYKSNKKVIHEIIGYNDESKKVPLDEYSLFRIFSNTKPITSVAILILIDRGRFLFVYLNI